LSTFREYINEGTNYRELDIEIPEAVDLIEKHCKPFLKMIKGTGGWLHRGVKKKSDVIMMRIISRLDRLPYDTDINMHNEMNQAFKEMFGWKARNGVFANTHGIWSHKDGVFFPIGKFRYVFSPEVGDLYSDRWQKESWGLTWKEYLKRKGYTNKGLGSFMSGGGNSEIMFDCRAYYLVKKSSRKELWEEMRERGLV